MQWMDVGVAKEWAKSVSLATQKGDPKETKHFSVTRTFFSF